MANCYICSGFIHSNDLKVVNHRKIHNNCWNRLDRKKRKELESSIEVKTGKFQVVLDIPLPFITIDSLSSLSNQVLKEKL